MPRDSEETQLLAAGAAEGGGGEGVVLLVQAGAARGGAEESADLLGEDAFALQARAPFADVELAAAQFADAVDDTVFLVGTWSSSHWRNTSFTACGRRRTT